MDYREYLMEKLKKFRKEDVVISDHALIRMAQRQISEKEVIENIINPFRLKHVIKKEAVKQNEEKFDCYFDYGLNQCHEYILAINGKIVVVTVVKINRRWQKIAEKRLKGNRMER